MKQIWLAFLVLFGIVVANAGLVDGITSYNNNWVNAEACRQFATITAGLAFLYATTVNITLVGWLVWGQLFKKS